MVRVIALGIFTAQKTGTKDQAVSDMVASNTINGGQTLWDSQLLFIANIVKFGIAISGKATHISVAENTRDS